MWQSRTYAIGHRRPDIRRAIIDEAPAPDVRAAVGGEAAIAVIASGGAHRTGPGFRSGAAAPVISDAARAGCIGNRRELVGAAGVGIALACSSG